MFQTFRRCRRLAVVILLALTSIVTFVLACNATSGEQPPSTPLAAEPQSSPATVSPPLFSPSTTSLDPAAPATDGLLALSAYRDGSWHIFALNPGEGQLRQLTDGAASHGPPAWSPDGRMIAFTSRRQANWDIYVMAADGGGIRRLTDDPHYDAAPNWSPDGSKIAFESYRAGDLDIFIMDSDGSNQRNLTPEEPYGDYGPAWSPDGKWIAFTTWRDGNKEIYLMRPDGSDVRNLTEDPAEDERPAWSPDGRQIAFVSRGKEGGKAIYLVDVTADGRGLNRRRLTWLGYEDWPAWSPDGEWIAFVSFGFEDQTLYVTREGELFPHRLGSVAGQYQGLAWNGAADIGGWPVVTATGPRTLFQEVTHAVEPEHGHPWGFRRLPGVKSPIPKLSDAVDDSFNALRERVVVETGYDYLAEVSEALRPLDFRSKTSDYLSWHKAGRAVDLLWELQGPHGQPLLEVVREDVKGETFWRLYIRTAGQDGSMGEPMKEYPWDFSYRARWIRHPWEGGEPKPIPYGYYVDFTALAKEYGWERISAWDEENFSWRFNKLAADYWHYEKRDNLTWYEAMLEVYSPEELEPYRDWDNLMDQGVDEYVVLIKGVPISADKLEELTRLLP
ncbi:MAG: TolB family protein [Anaerolineae bacterium]